MGVTSTRVIPEDAAPSAQDLATLWERRRLGGWPGGVPRRRLGRAGATSR
jgi:hypothetical protein